MLLPRSEYNDFLYKISSLEEQKKNKKIRDITFQVTENCNLRCSYCYQINKKITTLSFDKAKIFIDDIFNQKNIPGSLFYKEDVSGIVINFIGGEPLLETKLIEEIIDYFEIKFLEDIEHEWLYHHIYNFSSNGTLYFSEAFQQLKKKYDTLIHIGITVDGCKDFHDSCRLFPDGSGSYDLAIAAALKELKDNGNNSTKITLSPDNISYTFEAVTNLISLGFRYININCCFEDIWDKQSAVLLFNQLVKLANWIKENDLYNEIYIALFKTSSYVKATEELLNTSQCGASTGNMIALAPNGNYYPCIRFMESSLGEEIQPIVIGNTKNGILKTEEQQKTFTQLSSIKRKEISDKECLECPIAYGCSWCIGYCYQYYQNFNKKTNFICDTHKMAALATKYLNKIMNDKDNFNKIILNYNMYQDLIDLNTFNKINIWKEE